MPKAEIEVIVRIKTTKSFNENNEDEIDELTEGIEGISLEYSWIDEIDASSVVVDYVEDKE